jgi:hypothetical protein
MLFIRVNPFNPHNPCDYSFLLHAPAEADATAG